VIRLSSLDVVPYIVGDSGYNIWKLHLQFLLRWFGINWKGFMAIITFWMQIFRQKSCIITYTISGQCMVLHHHRKSVDWLTGVYPVQLRVIFGFLSLSCCCWHYRVAIPLLWWCSHDNDAVSEPKASCALQSHDWAIRGALVTRYIWRNPTAISSYATLLVF
jgi:hypothetical protein